jgi:uncharacterized membrane protein
VLVLSVTMFAGFTSVSVMLLAAFPAESTPLLAVQAFAVALPLLVTQFITQRAYPTEELDTVTVTDGGERR